MNAIQNQLFNQIENQYNRDKLIKRKACALASHLAYKLNICPTDNCFVHILSDGKAKNNAEAIQLWLYEQDIIDTITKDDAEHLLIRELDCY